MALSRTQLKELPNHFWTSPVSSVHSSSAQSGQRGKLGKPWLGVFDSAFGEATPVAVSQLPAVLIKVATSLQEAVLALSVACSLAASDQGHVAGSTKPWLGIAANKLMGTG
jgi:hypothetical protein